jgi:hypothetical protein
MNWGDNGVAPIHPSFEVDIKSYRSRTEAARA